MPRSDTDRASATPPTMSEVYPAARRVLNDLAAGSGAPFAVVTGETGIARSTFLAHAATLHPSTWPARPLRLDPSTLVPTLRDGLAAGWSPREWRRGWLTLMAQVAGYADDVDLAAQQPGLGMAVFLVGDLDDLVNASALDPGEQVAVRTLITDCLDWLREVPGRPWGLVAVLSPRLVRAVMPQNSAQFLARYRVNFLV